MIFCNCCFLLSLGTLLARTTINNQQNASSQRSSGQRNTGTISGIATHVNQAALTTSDSLSHLTEPGARVPSLATAAPATYYHIDGLRLVQQAAFGHLERNVARAFGREQIIGVRTRPQLLSEFSVHQNNERHSNLARASVQQGKLKVF